ncbi:hypothetical protein [Streptomyces sp. NPDC048643]|uniref:hypothetical protein n=1 Tax=Streptomyces sp. NPDC048643 TaxID=3155637 RepID=UPI003446D64C
MSKAVLTVIGTWVALMLAIALPALLPDRWEYYMISPASVVLWMISMLVGPVAVCWKLHSWIRTVPGDPQRPDN